MSRYRVEATATVKTVIQRLIHNANTSASAKSLLSIFKQIASRLLTDPTEFGEPMFTLPTLKMQLRIALVSPFVVHFGVNEEHRLVFINGLSTNRFLTFFIDDRYNPKRIRQWAEGVLELSEDERQLFSSHFSNTRTDDFYRGLLAGVAAIEQFQTSPDSPLVGNENLAPHLLAFVADKIAQRGL